MKLRRRQSADSDTEIRAQSRESKDATGNRRSERRLPGGVWVDADVADDVSTRPSRSWFRRSVRPQLKLRMHRSTTAHACTVYPWGVHSTLGHKGVYLGQDFLGGGGAFCFDPFEAYAQFSTSDAASNTNMMILGQPGQGKSSVIKTLLSRTAGVYGKDRFIAVVDVKPEYGPLAEVLNIPVVKLSPGGSVRVNPLEVRGRDESRTVRQVQMMQALTQTMLARDLNPVEDMALWSCIESLGKLRRQPTLADLVEVLRNPPVSVATSLRMAQHDVLEVCRDLTLAVESLVSRQLAGMFDGESTVSIDPDGPGVIIDISAVAHDQRALPLVMVAATAWLQELLTQPTQAKKIQVLDEAWKMVAFEATARYLQSCWKLGRTMGIANVAILHKPGDLGSQSADGSSASKIAQGLIADTSIRISFRQSPKDLSAYGDLFGWNETEQAEISELLRGQSLWKIGEKSVLLHHHLPASGPERDLCDTDQALSVVPAVSRRSITSGKTPK